MITLHVVQAHHGDALLLEHEKNGRKRHVLIDGGPSRTFDPYLRRALKSKVASNTGRLDLMVLSHVDADHVTGLLDLFVEVRSASAEGAKPLVKIAELWHNTFGLLDRDDDIQPRFESLMDVAVSLHQTQGRGLSSRRRASMALANLALRSIAQGERLGREARLARVPVNKRFRGAPIVATGSRRTDTRTTHGLKLRVVGPTEEKDARLSSVGSSGV